MSLLLNEDFSVYQLRLAYLQHIHDGVGERLINLNPSVLNNPAFRAAGWLPDNAAVRRCYSPPIPTTGAGVASEYFQAPRRPTRVSLDDEGNGGRGGMVTGHAGSEDTIGAGGIGASELRKRRRRREQMEEEDSSDLSDDSDDDERSAAHGIRFNKMPIRNRTTSDASPEDTFKGERDKPALNVISPSQPPDAIGQGLRRGSLGQVEAVKQRARRDTTTSSDFSSENELDPTAFNRKLPGRPGAKKSVMLAERIQEEEQPDLDGEGDDSDLEDEDVGEASDISDEFEVEDSAGISHTPNMLGIGLGGASEDTSPLKPPPNMPPAVTPHNTSLKKSSSKESLPKLPKLPPGRPISTVVPPSLITMALKGSGGSDEKAFQRFADLSGKGDPSPLWIKIYAPFSEKSTTAIEVPIRRQKEGSPVTVVELIGLALWRYNEEAFKPEFNEADRNVNRWTLRIVEDEEVDFDFPALGRTRPVTDFTSNNNRPPQRRARDKPWDEFGLVKATDEQFKENQALTPRFNDISNAAPASAAKQLPSQETLRPGLAERSETAMSAQTMTGKSFNPARNPITGPSFTLAPTSVAQRKDTGTLLDAPQQSTTTSTPRTGAPRTVTVHFTDPHSFSQSNLQIPTTTDTYLAEIFDHACKRLNLDKALYVLKVHGTQTVAPSDRTVEALADNLGLDLVRRRFIGAGAGDGMFGLGLSGSPGSSSPNAPLELVPTIGSVGASGAAGGGGKRRKGFALHNRPEPSNTGHTAHNAFIDTMGGKRYNVLRKQPLSFAPSHPRTLIITPEYLQILPAAPDSLAAPTGKVSNVPMSSVIGVKVSRKHPKMVRVLVYREKETKRYDFECASHVEAEGVCGDVRRGVEGARTEGFVGGGGGGGGSGT